MSILQISLSILSIPTPPLYLSSSRALSGPNHLYLIPKIPRLSIHITPKTTPIRMGGGPRTFPGGVSKWQWKRMQAKKAKQLLKARLARERQIYEMRKRAELKAAVSELERPWEVVERAPKLFSVAADEQVKVLADRFQKPGGFDMWSQKDGPQLFTHVDGVPSARFFPKGVVHSIKPYGKIEKSSDRRVKKLALPGLASEQKNGMERNRYTNSGKFKDGLNRKGQFEAKKSLESSMDRNGKGSDGKFEKNGKRRFGVENSKKVNGLVSRGVNADGKQRRETPARRNGTNVLSRGGGSRKLRAPNSEVCDMSLQHDGSYGFQSDNWGI
ncbi:hypothetical protein U1Q18_013430 [Sarracenia purpurea var. burkii]